MRKSPVMLIILDGFGMGPKKEGNAIQLAAAPVFRALEKGNHAKIFTSGASVGLPDGQMGNSEVGHMNIGSGRVVYQDFSRINKAIQDGEFFKNECLNTAFAALQKSGGRLHLMGLVSDGGVHSHIDHLFALLKYAKASGLHQALIHCFLDGRDTPYNSGTKYIQQLEAFLKQRAFGKIGSISGRYYAMDRDQRWDRIEKAYVTLTEGRGHQAHSARDALQKAKERGETDEFVQPTRIDSQALIEDRDTIIFFNFRADRARQLTRAFTEESLSCFKRMKRPKLQFVTMTQYHKKFTLPVIFPPLHLSNVLGEVLAQHRIPQLRIAETEKYAHVTFFFNGGEEKTFPGEERILIPSVRDVPTYDLKPQMSAPEITDTVIQNIQKQKFGFILLNFANADMVGHTGNLPAAIQTIETLDACLGQIINAIQNEKGHLLITADHGNAEQMIDPQTKQIHTAHTTYPVPFYYIHPDQKSVKLQDGILADFAPTILKIMDIDVPKEMTGKNLIVS